MNLVLCGGGFLFLALLPAVSIEQCAVGAAPGELLGSVLHVGEGVGGGRVVTIRRDDADIDHGEDSGKSEHACC